MKWILGGVLLPAAALAGSLASAKDAASSSAPPPYAGAYEPQGVDERGLWMQVDEAERQLRDLPIVLHDEELTGYVQGVLCSTVGQDRCSSARIYVVKDKEFNAGMYPNGLMIVHTGLLARVHSEAELATVLGHEFAHFELRHSLNSFRKRRGTSDAIAWISLAGAAAARTSGMTQSASMVQNALVLGYFSFGREQETEADLLAASYVRASDYPLRASIVWQRLLEERTALLEERKLRKSPRRTPGPTDTHPTDLQRIKYFSGLEAEAGAQDGDDRMAAYAKATARVLPELFDSLVRGNEFAAADYVIRSRGDAMGWDAQLLYTRGELYRLRGNPRDLVTARGFFESAAQQENAPAEAWRGLGYTALRTGDMIAGQAALRTYLEKAPNAGDLAAVQMMMETNP